MAYSPYDWNQAIRHRTEYIEERLRDGSPVAALSFPEGILLLTVRRSQRKIFEIYDRLIFAGIGNQSDLETFRLAAIDFAHREGFTRSPDDVTAQRLVGLGLSPAVKKQFGDPFASPFVLRAIYAELGGTREEDLFFMLNFDGEFSSNARLAVVAGTRAAEERMVELLQSSVDSIATTEQAVRLALEAWAEGRRHVYRSPDEDDEFRDSRDLARFLRDELADSTVEAGLLERHTTRESRFRLLTPADLQPALAEYR
jgi:proteasome alpha subunit